MRLQRFSADRRELPADPPDEASERSKLEGEAAKLRKSHSSVKDPEKALKEERLRRWDESKKRRAARKVERLQKLAARRGEWTEERKQTIVTLGSGSPPG